jgi:hypothetical protein
VAKARPGATSVIFNLIFIVAKAALYISTAKNNSTTIARRN